LPKQRQQRCYGSFSGMRGLKQVISTRYPDSGTASTTSQFILYVRYWDSYFGSDLAQIFGNNSHATRRKIRP
jgi:hypothetical protein